MSNPKVNWTSHTELIPCYLKDGETQKPVFVKFETSDTGIIELKVVQPLHNEPRENFDSLSTDIGEHFQRGHSNSPYKDYQGLFQNELQ